MVVSTRVSPVTVGLCIVLCLMAASVHSKKQDRTESWESSEESSEEEQRNNGGGFNTKVCQNDCVLQLQQTLTIQTGELAELTSQQGALTGQVATLQGHVTQAQLNDKNQDTKMQSITTDLSAAQLANQEQDAKLQAANDLIENQDAKLQAANDRIENQDAKLQSITTELSAAQLANQEQDAKLQNITTNLANQEQDAGLQAATDHIETLAAYIGIYLGDWLHKSCASNDDCPDRINLECFKGKCLCTPGYFYSKGKNLCVADCPQSDQVGGFLTYPRSTINGYGLGNTFFGVDGGWCQRRCASEPRCRTAKWSGTAGCSLITITPLQAPGSFSSNSDKYDLYQKRCV